MDKRFKELKRYVKVDSLENINGIEIYLSYDGKKFRVHYYAYGKEFLLSILLGDGTWGIVWSTKITDIDINHRTEGVDALINANLDAIKEYIKTIY